MTPSTTAPAAPTDDLLRELERERPRLAGYAYRMLGSSFEAEDAVQETMLRAWRSHATYEGRASLRSWLYRIATNVCVDMINGRGRRALPMALEGPSHGDGPAGTPVEGVAWIQPMPDSRLAAPGDPADAVASREDVRLAFVAALQHLQPRPWAIVILRGVLGWQATEVAELLDMTPTVVHSVLQRARRTLAAATHGDGPPPRPLDPADEALLARYVEAFERYDVDALVRLLHDDAGLSMPPNPHWMLGPAAIERWWRGRGRACQGMRMWPVRANGGLGVALYRPDGSGSARAFGIQVVEAAEGRIAAIHTFVDPTLFPLFDLPSRWPGDESPRPGRS